MAAREAHRMRWFVYADGDREPTPHTASMRGRWGWDAKCSCGWESHTGGAIRSFVQGLVDDHKWEEGPAND